jgi:hypothetical protein
MAECFSWLVIKEVLACSSGSDWLGEMQPSAGGVWRQKLAENKGRSSARIVLAISVGCWPVLSSNSISELNAMTNNTTTSTAATSPTSGTSTAQASPTSTEPTAFSRQWDGIRRSGTRNSTNAESITEIKESCSRYLPKDSDPELSLPRTRTFSSLRRDSTLTTLDELERVVHGYPRLATFMGHEPGAAIYRRFASLNARVLLYRQAEIVCLEHELDQLEQAYAGGEHKHLHYSVRHLMHAKPGGPGHDLWEKVSQLDSALERYNALLLQQKALYELPAADDIGRELSAP